MVLHFNGDILHSPHKGGEQLRQQPGMPGAMVRWTAPKVTLIATKTGTTREQMAITGLLIGMIDKQLRYMK